MNLSGQTLGDFQLQGLISRGPRASVYRARQLPADRSVAVKVYDDSADPDVVQRAVDSVEALTQANVLPVYGFGVHQGRAYVAMRLMPVGSLKSRWPSAAPLSDIARILPQVAAALDHAHHHGLLHLNLKPANILIDHPGNAFVADFGIPPQLDSPYTAPEVGRNGPVNARADVYGLGAVLYELLTGRAPVARRSHGEDKVNRRPVDLSAPRSIRSAIPKSIEDVVMRALSINPDARYATPGALADAFAEAMRSVPGEQATAVPRSPLLRWIALGAIGILIVIGALMAANGSITPATVASATPSPTIADSFTSTPTRTHTPASTAANSSTPAPTRTRTSTPTRAATGTPTPSVSPTRVLTATTVVNRTPTPLFSVISLKLKEPPTRIDYRDRLVLFFDAVVQPPTGGPFGQLFAFVPEVDPLVTTRIGAQVSSGTQLLHVTLIVDCGPAPDPIKTNRVALEIRATDLGPALYSTTIEYLKTWCQ